jgi:hypothetical protein
MPTFTTPLESSGGRGWAVQTYPTVYRPVFRKQGNAIFIQELSRKGQRLFWNLPLGRHDMFRRSERK